MNQPHPSMCWSRYLYNSYAGRLPPNRPSWAFNRPERDRVVAYLTPEEKERYKADIHAMNILLQGLPKDIYTLINHYTNAKDIWDNVKMLLEGFELTKDEQYFKDKMLLMQAREKDSLDEDSLLLNATMFMENLSSTDLIYDEAGPSYDSDILFEVQDHDNYLDSVDEYQEYVKKNAEQVVQSNVSSVPNDALIMIINDMHDQTVQCVSANEQDKEKSYHQSPAVVHDSEDNLELAERTRIGILEKMKSPIQLSAEQIFWSSVPKPISEMTVYPPNTPARLVPRVLPTKSQVKINIYTLMQLFTKFDKTYKMRNKHHVVSQKGKGVSNKQRNVTLLSVGITHQKSVPRTPQQNGVVERQNHTLVEAAQTMLIFSRALMFLWAEVVATACYTQNRSPIHTQHNKTQYELLHDKKPDLKFL
ncbi:retrovirus-related pol polyprotein from transposon TNT 1-94 [Tanacetum coccineum]